MYVANGLVAQEQDLPSPQTVVRDYIEALGSEMALLGLESIKITGTYTGASSGNMEFFYADGKARLNFNPGDDESQQIAYAYDGEFAWQKIRGVTTLNEGEPADNSREGTTSPTIALYWAEYPGKIRMVGRVDLDDSEAYHLEFTSPQGTVFDRYFDVHSNLLVKTVLHNKTANHTITNTFEYQTVEGIQFLLKKKQYHSDDYSFEYNYDLVELNVDVDKSMFEVPEELQEQAEQQKIEKEKADTDK